MFRTECKVEEACKNAASSGSDLENACNHVIHKIQPNRTRRRGSVPVSSSTGDRTLLARNKREKNWTIVNALTW